jgi:hypothetical protein
MLGAGKKVELTPELKKQEKLILKIWRPINKHLIPRSQFAKNKCEKCANSDNHYNHREHLSKLEIRKDKIATSILLSLRGAWN